MPKNRSHTTNLQHRERHHTSVHHSSATVSSRFTKPVNQERCFFTVQILKAPSYESVLNCRETVLCFHQHGRHLGSDCQIHMIVRSHEVNLALQRQRRSPVVGRDLMFCQVVLLGLGIVLPGNKHVLCFHMHANFAAKDMASAIVNKPCKMYEPAYLNQT